MKMDEDFKAQTLKAINDLHSIERQHLNRLLACEALLHSLIAPVDPQALAALGEEYDATIDRMASTLEPKYQQPHLWAAFADAIADRQRRTQALPPSRTPGAY